jgi:hypothetical protein
MIVGENSRSAEMAFQQLFHLGAQAGVAANAAAAATPATSTTAAVTPAIAVPAEEKKPFSMQCADARAERDQVQNQFDSFRNPVRYHRRLHQHDRPRLGGRRRHQFLRQLLRFRSQLPRQTFHLRNMKYRRAVA